VFSLGLLVSGCASGFVCEYVPSNTLVPVVQANVSPPVTQSPQLDVRPPRASRPARRTPGSNDFRLSPQTPEAGTPEATREQEQTDRRERDLQRRMRGICRGC
jgi:hypothetical protein